MLNDYSKLHALSFYDSACLLRKVCKAMKKWEQDSPTKPPPFPDFKMSVKANIWCKTAGVPWVGPEPVMASDSDDGHRYTSASSGQHADAAHVAESAEASLPDTQLLDSQPMFDDCLESESQG